MKPLPTEAQTLDLARAALRRRDDLAGAGRSIMESYGLTEPQARQLHADEVARRVRENDRR